MTHRPDISPVPEPGDRGIAAALTPRQIVEELDQYIIGQDEAKKAVAIALRNRWRRQNVDEGMREEILPNNIILIGPTGVGKTEIARRLSRLAGAPFIKVEASKFTEVGYVGRDVESMIRDLLEIAIKLVREEQEARHGEVADRRVEERLLDLLLPPVAESEPAAGSGGDPQRQFVVSLAGQASETRSDEPSEQRKQRTREKLRGLLRDGMLDEREVEVEVSESAVPMLDVGGGMESLDFNVGEVLKGVLPKKTRRRRVSVADARRILRSEELANLVDMEEVTEQALRRTESMGIVFLDEIDKVAGKHGGAGPDVSREGVQRDLLPIVEGSTVQTRHGMVRTDHILFIAAGAFHIAKPSDLIPELQGRFPIRVELESLDAEAFTRILQEPRYALLAQYRALVETESARLEFEEGAVREIARIASQVNERTENIGARRLHTVLSTLLEKILFDLPEARSNETIAIDADFVRDRLSRIADDEDLRRYIL
ncbi:MAG: ATP-dependent protease ATPase subunit HslU [Gemmatimonadales bacterium]|nr:ATP-dependent protease ATPase subunit HslU [Gemmatimonadales bacterium]MYG48796.1 ATP-dependent protease ATPase subunit HslU [Gemmatimonadales bacterium]MYK01192.1 ATP-dependent protease ATPase subunit HslU [Candidatus Palauibacter ramosifaciens]